MVLTPSRVFLAALAAATANLIPLLIVHPGGDIFFHYTLIQCFSHQFWQGDLHPHWCMEANAGLGSPVFLFYYPLPYYIAALFYPILDGLGFSIEAKTLFLFWLASVITFFTAWLWLKDIVSPGRALLGALLYLFMPYRMKLMLFSEAFAELWCLAWLPLLFLYTRRLLAGQRVGLKLALVITVSLFTHLSATVFGVFASSLQILFASRRRLILLCIFAGSTIFALMATSIYWLPAMHARQFLNPDALSELRLISANRYMTMDDISAGGHARAAITQGCMLVIAGLISILAVRHKERLPLTIRRETALWIAVVGLGVVLASFLSGPLWRCFDYVMMGILPWRAQALIMYGTVFLLAVKMQWLMTEKQMKTWKGDFTALMILTVLLDLLLLTTLLPMEEEYRLRVERAHIVGAREYRPVLTDPAMFSFDHLLALSDAKYRGEKPQHEADGCRVKSWDYRGIVLHCDRKIAGEIPIGNFYFGLWQASIDGAPAAGLHPQEHTGTMLLPVPAGAHEVRLTFDVAAAMGWRYTLAKALSLIAAALLAVIALSGRIIELLNRSKPAQPQHSHENGR